VCRIVGIPLPPVLWNQKFTCGRVGEIFDVKELAGKIFRTKHLALAVPVFEGHARRVRVTY
jgi:hypothetical protein